jgi:hypothetical protein
LANSVLDPAAIRVNQATEQTVCLPTRQMPLPWREVDAPGVLAAGAMLWKQARPVSPVSADDNAAVSRLQSDALARRHRCDRTDALVDDPWLPGIKADSQSVDATTAR